MPSKRDRKKARRAAKRIAGTSPPIEKDLAGAPPAVNKKPTGSATQGKVIPPAVAQQRLRPVWGLSRIFWDDKDALGVQSNRELGKMLRRLATYETTYWDEVLNKPHCHDWQDLTVLPASSRLALRNAGVEDDTTAVCQLVGPGKGCRIIGLRDYSTGRFDILFYDHAHKFYPTS